MIDKSKLKELALAATPGPWDFDTAETPIRIAGGEVVGGDALPYGDVYTMQEYETPDGLEPLVVAQEIGADNGRFVAAANPSAILELLAELDRATRALVRESAAPVAGSQHVPQRQLAEAFCIAKRDPMAWDDPDLDGERAAFSAVFAAAPAVPVPVEQGWISVEDRLPPKNSGLILVTNNIKARNAFGGMSHVWLSHMLYKNSDSSFTAFARPSDSRVEYVTHWMPLPAAPSLQQGKEGAGDE